MCIVHAVDWPPICDFCRCLFHPDIILNRMMHEMRWPISTFASPVPYLYRSISTRCCKNAVVARLKTDLLERSRMMCQDGGTSLSGHVHHSCSLVSRCCSELEVVLRKDYIDNRIYMRSNGEMSVIERRRSILCRLDKFNTPLFISNSNK